MGHAAYLRGNAVISRQIDAEVAASRLVSVDKYELQALADERDRAMALADELKRELNRAKRSLSERRLTLRMEREEHQEAIRRLKKRARAAELSLLRTRSAHRRCSSIVRDLLTPEQVQDWRREVAAVEDDQHDYPAGHMPARRVKGPVPLPRSSRGGRG